MRHRCQGIVELNEVDVCRRNKRQPTCLYAWSSKGRCPVSRRDCEREMTVESMPMQIACNCSCVYLLYIRQNLISLWVKTHTLAPTISWSDLFRICYILSLLVAQLVERPPGLPMCSQKECPTKFETRWLQEIPYSKELTNNCSNCALGLLFESKICNNSNNNNTHIHKSCVTYLHCANSPCLAIQTTKFVHLIFNQIPFIFEHLQN